MRLPALMILACIALAGCGGEDSGGSGTPAPGSPPRPGVGAELDEAALETVHDTLYECLRKAGGGVLARYVNGQASVADTFSKVSYDDELAAPDAERKLIEAGDVQFIGVRANRRDRADRGLADVDVLIFRSPDRAQEALPSLSPEAANAEQDGIYVRIVKRPGKGGRTLKRCFDEARPGR